MEIRFLRRKKKFKKGGSGIKPNLYWKYILYTTFSLVLISCVFGVYLFVQTNKEPIPPVVNAVEQNAIKKERFKRVLEYFSERERKSVEILNFPSPIIDPSL